MPDYRGSSVVVTGGGSGLGAAIADRFAHAGARIALLDVDGTSAEAKAVELRAEGADAISLAVDVADAASLTRATAIVQQKLGGCDVLCANVGVQQFGAIETLSEADWQWVISVNVMGVIHSVRAFLPLLRRSTRAKRHVVLTASASFFQPAARMAAYVTTKYAVVGYGEVLRRELAAEGINVTLLFPAGMTTRHLESSAAARPEALGPSLFDMEDLTAMLADAQIDPSTHTASPDYAVRSLLEELERRPPYIITHGAYRDRIEQDHRAILDAYARMEGTKVKERRQ
ncbi:SDR family NAD(P)-dependent oxidoreductase [Sphingobium tyrosinilyticum]|uniref:SDR family NAD(P)-dependent oxidoreductase n=1 Tax=Sphingobium tyrosinilyticum TaxID=2715436 RepID=A0ABV9F1D3_9SPHN